MREIPAPGTPVTGAHAVAAWSLIALGAVILIVLAVVG